MPVCNVEHARTLDVGKETDKSAGVKSAPPLRHTRQNSTYYQHTEKQNKPVFLMINIPLHYLADIVMVTEQQRNNKNL